MKVAQKKLTALTDNHFASLYDTLKNNGDQKNADKIIDLYDKKNNKQFNICFSGHFSAGKSSMINYLLGMDVLPKSPIPTSANIVQITSGEGVARVYFTNTSPVEYEEPYDIDMIKDFAMDKDTIKKIEISTSDAILPKNCSILDTPGIDAADDADRLMTESALHIVDILYYVMDYNHVQSEVNLYFLQEIQNKNIPFYIIINQVDKHNDEELSFTEFDSKVKQTFDQWNIFPNKIYYSSVINEQAEHNQIKMIKEDLYGLLTSRSSFSDRIDVAVNELIEDHKKFLEEENTNELAELNMDSKDAFDVQQLETINSKIKEIKNRSIEFRKEFEDEINQTLKNAYLMPAKLRDQAGLFLESQQKDFKVGFLNSKKKTEEEKEIRLDSFLNPLQKTIESTIQWKLRDKFIQMLHDYHINDESLREKAQQIGVAYGKDHLISFLKDGATINGNYILNYTNDISNDIKTRFRQQANKLLQTIEEVSSKSWKQEIEIYETEKTKYEGLQQIAETKEKLNEQLNEQITFLDSLLENPWNNRELITQLQELIKARKVFSKEKTPTRKDPQPLTEQTEVLPIEPAKIPRVSTTSIEDVVETIEKVTNELIELDGFISIVNDLKEKQDKLGNRELTIALFGAFSAGKSSFSNALFGEQILPVSPNPTTAVISRISPVNDKHTHGNVIITLKDEDTLVNDLKTITKDLSPTEDSFEGIINWIKQHQIHEHPELTKTYQSYLLAILNGYELRKDQLGKTISIQLEEFAAFVTDESKACYIETVDLYYDCDLTRKGITLVDTPGADSVNARHTNVAFDYIKQADAIIYVTYYNHAITSADRDFLIQLGRVKEAFELDKMFFIVNASDLAQDKSELALVLNYVEEQLLQFGIRHPKIFPVSSKASLEEKVNHLPLNEEMKNFENDFYTFIEEDLAALTIQAAIWDINRAKLTLSNFITSANLDQSVKKEHIEQLNSKRETFKHIINNTNTDVSGQRLKERIERQLHFVLERLYIRFHDMFTEHFNPTTITKSGRQAVSELEHNRNQFIDHVGYELLQEVRAVSLRIEAYIKELLKNTFEQIQEEITRVDQTFIIPSFKEPSIDTPEYEQAFNRIDMKLFTDALKVFKNTRSFFEQNEREKMKDKFYEALQPLAKKYLDLQKYTMEDKYESQWDQETDILKERIESEINSVIDQNIKVLTEVVDVDMLKSKYNQLEAMLSVIYEDDKSEK
ncbi:dynamin family protein [Pseudogracilibacillus sp. SE30717A]|uniref:dynamin family protein n=1 Tax=Pseudogracilibacillus sp. SE30717A TaxID=3098293 RepID=UPI00300DF5D5